MINPDEIEITAIRSSGPGGQNVNKVSSAIHLRFDIRASSLPESSKNALLRLRDRHLSRKGEIIIKAQRHRSQEQNREDALRRLAELIESASRPTITRKTTRPPRASRQQRLDDKRKRGITKQRRSEITTE